MRVIGGLTWGKFLEKNKGGVGIRLEELKVD